MLGNSQLMQSRIWWFAAQVMRMPTSRVANHTSTFMQWSKSLPRANAFGRRDLAPEDTLISQRAV